MKGLTFNVFKGFRTEDEMLTYYKTKAYFDNITVLAGMFPLPRRTESFANRCQLPRVTKRRRSIIQLRVHLIGEVTNMRP